MKKKTLAIILAVVVLVSVITTGTIAWLTATTPTITNTFAPSNIGLFLSESTGSTYKMVPGEPITKNPIVTVSANSEACYVFVKVEEKGGNVTIDSTTYSFDDYITYVMADGWKELDANEYPGVYYREVASSTSNQPFVVIGNKGFDGTETFVENEVLVKETVTKQMMGALTLDDPSTTDVNESNCPTLTVTAYAIQSANLTDSNADTKVDAADAWALLNTP